MKVSLEAYHFYQTCLKSAKAFESAQNLIS